MPVISANASARAEGYFRLEWKLAVDRSHLIAAERAFIVPVVIDETRDGEALVPDKFREVQWTRCPEGQVPAKLVERLAHLLSPDDHKVTTANVRASATIPPLAPTLPRTSRRLGLIGAVTVVVLLVVGAVVAYKTAFHSAAIGMVAVLPFENATGDPANEYLSNGISESLINKLSRLRGLHVISRTSSFAFKGKKSDPTEIGEKLGVDALILGSLTQHGSSLNVTAELVSVRDATQLWGEKYARSVDDVLQIEGDIAATIAQTLHRRLSGDEKVMLTRDETSDPEAYRLYLKGREFLVGTDQEMDKSIDYFQQAVARAPDYAMAHAGLADAYTVQAFLRASGRAEAAGKARAAVSRALELDPDLGEAHAALAAILYLFEWDWAGADAEFRRGISLSPGSEAVHEAYGSFLSSMGRLDEGLAQSREAARLDPLSVQPFHDMAINALIRGDYDQAAAGFRHTIDIDPDWTWGYIKLGRTLSLQKNARKLWRSPKSPSAELPAGLRLFRDRGWVQPTRTVATLRARARSSPRCTLLKRNATSIRQLSLGSTPALARWTRPCIGIRKHSRSGRRTWCTRWSRVESRLNLPVTRAIRRSSAAWPSLSQSSKGRVEKAPHSFVICACKRQRWRAPQCQRAGLGLGELSSVVRRSPRTEGAMGMNQRRPNPARRMWLLPREHEIRKQ